MNNVEEKCAAFLSADAAWTNALVRRYGRSACDVRYTAEGRSDDLAPLYERFMRAQLEWQLAKAESRIAELMTENAMLRQKVK